MLQKLLACAWIATSTFASMDPDYQKSTLRCKPKYASSDWPPASAWQQLNESVSGRLVPATPPGAVCHPSMAEYNNVSCSFVTKQWTNTSFHALNLVSADYNDVACLPRTDAPCSLESYPRFVVSAESVSDVQKAVSFAREKHVRLIVKGTGHDAPGRSSGSDALSIQTHNMRGLSLRRGDFRALALGGIASLRIQAGERMVDIYRFAAANNLTIVGGAEPHVGIGGWISYGGHGPVSAYYGLGADQVLEMEIVTADGVLRTVNETSNPDLFWALRGGGASSFGVIVSVTVKAYDLLPYTSFNFSYNTTADSDIFWTMVAYFHNALPQVVKSGLMGYFWVTPYDATEPNATMQGKLHGEWFAPNMTVDQVRHHLALVEKHIKSDDPSDAISVSGDGDEHPDYTKGFATHNGPDSAGVPVRLGSRLLDEQALSKPISELKVALRNASGGSAHWPILGHVIAGPGTWSPRGGIPGGSNAVLPAWRKACMQMALPRSWDPLNQTQFDQITTTLRTEEVQILRDLAPDMGSYASEADPTEPNWKDTFYGRNYPRLLALKRRWDPLGVFWHKNAVGSELWRPEGPYGVENGVGQKPVQLCKAEDDM